MPADVSAIDAFVDALWLEDGLSTNTLAAYRRDLTLFADLAKTPPVEQAEELPLRVVVPAFVTSELKTAFQIGFVVFLPFLIIDMVVASVLMSMGMMMMSPVIVALPFKLLVFVLVDGWTLLIGSLVKSFALP